MNKALSGLLFLTILLAFSGIAVAQEDHTRVIVHTTSSIDKAAFKSQGCTIMHELNDATALKCPKGIEIKNAVEDRRYHATDMDANVQIDAVGAWAIIPSPVINEVVVAVLDTGIDTDHPELVLSIEGGMSFVDYTTSYEDDGGHGTHVSGIITADGVGGAPYGYARGVAPDTKIWAGKVLDYAGGGWGSDVAAAIEHVVKGPDGNLGTGDDHIADIISLSLGGGNFDGDNCDYLDDVLVNAVNWANEQGVAVVVSSGNDIYFVGAPACASGAIAVGAVDKSDKMASFSNFGPSLDIVAPGVDIYSSVPGGGYDSWDGTSMAAPHVSGTIALMLEANPSLSVDDIKDVLYTTADPIDEDSVCYVMKAIPPRVVPCSSDYYGAGVVDAYGAVDAVIAVCGNGLVEYGEVCDDGNTADGDLCSSDCKSETSAIPEFPLAVIPALLSLLSFGLVRRRLVKA